MPATSRTFSESWFRIADQSIWLRPYVRVHRQFFRGEKWYILEDPYSNTFFRLKPSAYDFVIRLGPGKTVETVWKESLASGGENAPGQEEAIQLLAQLYHANLLHYRCSSDSLVLFERFRQQREMQVKSRLLTFMFPRITLLDPDRFIVKTLPWVRFALGRWAVVVWALCLLFAGKCVVENFSEAADQAQALLAPSNILWLYAGLVLIKTLHEFGHAYVCRLFGGEVHRMGISLLIFTPVPFVDATSSWALRSRRDRILVVAAGMMVELFVAAVCAILWSYSRPGLFHSVCYNIMFIGSMSTLLFNGNPLLWFDGYFILSDLLDIPNLHPRSRGQLQHVVETYLLGNRQSVSFARSRSESVQLVVFVLASVLYRIVIFTSIVFFVSSQMLIVGAILAVLFVVAWGIVPVFKFVRYLFVSPRLARSRWRAVGVTAAVALAAWGLFRFVPVPAGFRASGVTQASTFHRIYARTRGALAESRVTSGTMLAAGDTIAVLENPFIDGVLAQINAQEEEIAVRQRKALKENQADLKPLAGLADALAEQKRQILEDKKNLVIRAPGPGVWGGADLGQLKGVWLMKGTELGLVVGKDGYEFVAVVSQSEASRLFDRRIRRAEVRLVGQSDRTIPVSNLNIIPVEQKRLPSATLGWQTGGEVVTDISDPAGLRTGEPFFQVIATLDRRDDVVLRHGLTGQIRFQLPAEPLLPRMTRLVRQTLQTKYGW